MVSTSTALVHILLARLERATHHVPLQFFFVCLLTPACTRSSALDLCHRHTLPLPCPFVSLVALHPRLSTWTVATSTQPSCRTKESCTRAATVAWVNSASAQRSRATFPRHSSCRTLTTFRLSKCDVDSIAPLPSPRKAQCTRVATDMQQVTEPTKSFLCCSA